MRCDVCNSTLNAGEGVEVPPARFRRLLERGFGIDETSIAMLTDGNLVTREQAIGMLKAQYELSGSNWLFCHLCESKAKEIELRRE